MENNVYLSNQNLETNKMKTINYNGVKINYTSFQSVFDAFLKLNMVTLLNGDNVAGQLMLTNKEFKSL